MLELQLFTYGKNVLLLQEAMKLQQDMRKKKQEMLEKQIECQKVGLDVASKYILVLWIPVCSGLFFPGILCSCSFIIV